MDKYKAGDRVITCYWSTGELDKYLIGTIMEAPEIAAPANQYFVEFDSNFVLDRAWLSESSITLATPLAEVLYG